ncbi:MAG: AsmA-like C-terminal region-containing protein [Bacteroidales bacterium]|nr:AsmA-like C-terminal region-containing protein [Bacteroidales bacterium]
MLKLTKFAFLLKNKTIKITAIIFIIFTFLYVTAGICINYFLSPEVLTPIIVNNIHLYSNSDVTFEKAELSMFKHFPTISLSFNKGSINVKQDSASIIDRNDSLCTFKNLEIRINPYSYLMNKKVHISSLILDSASVSMFTDNFGKTNWENIILQDSISSDSTSSDISYVNSIKLGKIELNDISLNIDDRLNHINSSIKNFSGELKGNFSLTDNNLDINFNTHSINLSQEKAALLKDMQLGAHAQISLNLPNKTLIIENGVFKVNGISMSAKGYMRYDSIANSTEVEISSGLEVPSLETVLNLIPKTFLKEGVDMKTSGEANLTAEIKGNYDKTNFPTIQLFGEINNGTFRYEPMEAGIEELNLKFLSNIDLNNHKESNISIERFEFKALSSYISLNGRINDFIDNPSIKGDIKANLDFNELTKIFPLKDSVSVNGKLKADMSLDFIVSEFMNQNLNRFKAKGSMLGSDIKIESPNDSIFIVFDKASILFKTNSKDNSIQQGRNFIDGDIQIDNLDIKYKNNIALMKQGYMSLKSSPLKDTTAILSLTSNIDANRYQLKYNDSIYIKGGKTNIAFKLSPSKKDKLLPKVESKIKMDSIFVMYENHRMRMLNGEFNLISEKDSKENKFWNSEGKIGYSHLGIFSKDFPLLIKLPKSTLTLYDNKLKLDETVAIMGESHISLDGNLENIKQFFLNEGKLHGKLDLKAQYINVNEIIKALEISDEEKTALSSDSINNILEGNNEKTGRSIAAQDNATSDSLSIFVIPENLDLVLNTDIKAIKLGKLDIENFNGELYVRNQCIEVENLSFHSAAADMVATLLYRAKDKEKAYTGFDIRMKDIKVGELVNFVPALDTLVPMLNSLDGVVNFNIAAESELDKNLSPVISSINSAINLRGDSLILMNGDTFAEISKMLRFKNKDKNIIDSVAVNLIVRNGMIEVYPFSVSIDRYQAAIAGKHSLESGFDYHISLLESPIPFKIGVNIKGDMDNFKFRICKPKFKNLNDVARLAPLDSTSQIVRKNIKKTLLDEIKQDTTALKIESF